jgi:sulfur carrier protein
VQITLNGDPHQVPDDTTVAQLLEGLGLGRFPLAVERNRQVVPKEQHGATVLEPGDAIEVVTFVGGG